MSTLETYDDLTDWVFDVGAGLVTATGGKLAWVGNPPAAQQARLYRPDLPPAADRRLCVEFNRGTSGSQNFQVRIALKRTGGDTALIAGYDAAGGLNVVTYRAGVGAVAASTGVATRPAVNKRYWVTAEQASDQVTVALWDLDPHDASSEPLHTFQHALTGANQADFGADVSGVPGLNMVWSVNPSGNPGVRADNWEDGYVTAPLPAVTEPQAAAAKGRIGVYRSSKGIPAVAAFEAFLQHPVGFALDFLDELDWGKVESPAFFLDPAQGGWLGSPYKDRMVIGLQMLVESNTGGATNPGVANPPTLAEGATGAYDVHYTRWAQAVAGYYGSDQLLIIVRIGWEFNGDWFKWKVTTGADELNFAAYFARIAAAVRAVLPNAQFEWCLNCGNAGAAIATNVERCYPGDAAVDYVGMDVYDQTGFAIADPTERWNTKRAQQYGVEWARTFAAEHGKPLVFPEWGLSYAPPGGSGGNFGGGDDPLFIGLMADYIARYDIAYHNYWNKAGLNELTPDLDGNNPESRAMFLTRFGGTVGPPVLANALLLTIDSVVRSLTVAPADRSLAVADAPSTLTLE